MSRIIDWVKRIIAVLSICGLAIFTIMGINKGVEIDFPFCMNIFMCFVFFILLLIRDDANSAEEKNIEEKKQRDVYILLVLAIFLSIVEQYMFYEELAKTGNGISCMLLALIMYRLFDAIEKNKV